MTLPLFLSQADHSLESPVVAWSATYLDAHPPQVRLVASIESGPRQTTAPSAGQTATNLATAMDARVAIHLYEQLGDLIREMHWQQYVTGGRPV
jgi:hypothetical protein